MAPNPALKAGQSKGSKANDIDKNKKGINYKVVFPNLFQAIKDTQTAPSWTDLGVYIGVITTNAELITVQTHRKDKESKQIEPLSKPDIKINKLTVQQFLGQLDIQAGHATKKGVDLLEDHASDIRKGILVGWTQFQTIQKDVDLTGDWNEVLTKIQKVLNNVNSKDVHNLFKGFQKLTVENGTTATQKKAKPAQRDQVKKLIHDYQGLATKGEGMTKDEAKSKALQSIGINTTKKSVEQPTEAVRLEQLLLKMSIEEIQNAIRGASEDNQIIIFEKLDAVVGVDELVNPVG